MCRLVVILLVSLGVAYADCSLVETGNTPLPDMGDRLHHGFEGGLYPGGVNSRPQTHEQEGIRRAEEIIKPLDAEGTFDPTSGKVVMISVGMSNTRMEFDHFIQKISQDPSLNSNLVIIDTAQGGKSSEKWTDSDALAWDTVHERNRAPGRPYVRTTGYLHSYPFCTRYGATDRKDDKVTYGE